LREGGSQVQAAGAMSPKRTETTELKLDIWTWGGGNPGHNISPANLRLSQIIAKAHNAIKAIVVT